MYWVSQMRFMRFEACSFILSNHVPQNWLQYHQVGNMSTLIATVSWFRTVLQFPSKMRFHDVIFQAQKPSKQATVLYQFANNQNDDPEDYF